MRMIPPSIICFSNSGRQLEEPLVLFVGAESHHALDAGPVVPAPVEDDDLAGGGKVLHVPLHVHLALLAVGRRGQRDEAEDARARALRDRLDRAALARRVAAFEDDDDAQALSLSPNPAARTVSPAGASALFRTSSASSSSVSSFAIVRPRPSGLRLPAAAERPVQLRAGPQLGPAGLREQQLLLEQLLIGGQDLDVAREAGVVPLAGQIGRVLQGGDACLAGGRAARPASES